MDASFRGTSGRLRQVDFLMLKINLRQRGGQTSYHKQVQFREGLEVQGEIITEDMRLFNGFITGSSGSLSDDFYSIKSKRVLF
jgi:hypothetical protein